ncbi:MAG: hypothetical protein JXA93_07525 [Anaerolineae bacterium]|nr:hypothetical protein [Anaerolineae bacterium]
MIVAKKNPSCVFLLLVLLLLLAGLVAVSELDTVQADGCWQAELTEQWTNMELAGSVLRVGVQGRGGLPVYVRSSGGFEVVGLTGTKPEYGPNVAEFAPLSKGTYTIEPQGLGTTYTIWLDGKGYARVDFKQVPCAPTATPTASPTSTRRATATRTPSATSSSAITATPRPSATPAAGGWRGREVERVDGLQTHLSTIAVRVIGRPAGQQVEIRSGAFSATCVTGTKPEHGPDACEFGALQAGTYQLLPTGLNTRLDVRVDLHEFVLVEFYDTTPPPAMRWVGSIVENRSGSEPTEHSNSAIAVVVNGKPWHKVVLRVGQFEATCLTSTKPEYGDACEFGGLSAGTYTITPANLDTSVQITVDGWGWAKVRFDEVPAPLPPPAGPTRTPTARPTSRPTSQPTSQPSNTPTPRPTGTPATGWQSWIISNTSDPESEGGVWSVIVIRVLNYGGIPVHIRTSGGFEATCITGSKPEIGPDACEFSALSRGTYYLRPDDADLETEIWMDGRGRAEVHFAHP